MTTSERQSGPRQPTDLGPPQGSGRDNQANYPPSLGGPPPGSSFKANTSQQNLQDQDREPTAGSQQGKEWEEAEEVDIRVLMQKYEELQGKYSKVKRYYFDKEAQVQQLQNTVAHQRMAISRTVLDDNEYSNRFNRLDAAIKDLAFSIRKGWSCVPPWLQPFVNEEAPTVGTKEMTAVGRAVISRWLVDEIFDRHFHPSLELNLSVQLKNIERNLRRQQGPAYSDEDKDNQVARISNWRRTTLDGLSDVLQGKSAVDSRMQLVETLVDKLVASLDMFHKEPLPADVGHGARTIVENSMGIAEKIPLESRDICVDYFMPGTPIAESLMRVESTLPPLTNPGSDVCELDRERRPSQGGDGPNDDMEADKDTAKDGSSASTPNSATESTSVKQPNAPPSQAKKRHGLGSLISKKSSTSPGSVGQQDPARPGSARDNKERGDTEKQESRPLPKIRFSAFIAVEVKGKGPNNVLMKAPVYGLAPVHALDT